MTQLTAQELWQTALRQLEARISRQNFATWLQGTVGLRYEGDSLVVGVPSPFAQECLERRLRFLVEKTLASLANRQVALLLELRSQADANPGPGKGEDGSGLPAKYTFENFVVGDSNCFAYAAALKVAEEPGGSYNPLYLYAAPGLGKTHLLQAIGHRAQARGFAVLSTTCEQFTNDFITSLQEGSIQDFRLRFRRAQLLLIDDVQFFSGKEQTQEFFFHTFNYLYERKGQIVLTGDRLPQALPSLEERLRSRLASGLSVHLQPPSYELRLAILQARAHVEGVQLPLEILEYIAHRQQASVRELEATLNKLLAYSHFTGRSFTLDLAESALGDLAQPHPQPTLKEISDTVSRYFGLEPRALAGRGRSKELALARQLAMYLMRKESGASLREIGQALGGREPRSVLYSCDKIAHALHSHPQVDQALAFIRQSLYRELEKG